MAFSLHSFRDEGGVMTTYKIKTLQLSDQGFVPREYSQLSLHEAVDAMVHLSLVSRVLRLEMVAEDEQRGV
jgi:hypothetical protein